MVVMSPSRIGTILKSFYSGDPNSLFWNVMHSLSDYYYMPSHDWGAVSIVFTHFAAFIFLYILLAGAVKYSEVFKKDSTTLKFLVYLILLPVITVVITLFLPSV